MTAIVVFKEGKKIIMGADSVCSAGNVVGRFDNEQEYKICRVKGSPSCIIGASGSSALCKAIRQTPMLLDGKNDPSFDYMVKVFVPKIFSIAKRENSLNRDNDGNIYVNLGLIISTKSHIYRFSDYGEIFEVGDYCSIGCGSFQTDSKYNSLRNNKTMSIREKALACLKHAVENNSTIGYPLVFISNDEEGIEVLQN